MSKARGYALAVLFTGAAFGATFTIDELIGPTVFPLFFVAVILSTYAGGLGPGLLSTFLSVVLLDIFFFPPRGTLVHDALTFFRLALFAAVAVAVVLLTAALRRARDRLRLLVRDREDAYGKLEEEENLLRVTLAQLPAGVVIVRSRRGDILLANQKAHQLLGLEAEQALKAEDFHLLDVRRPDGRPFPAEEWPIYRAVMQGENVVDEELSYVRSDGRRLTVLVGASPLRNGEGGIVGGVASFVDITERRRAEEVIRANERLFRSVLEALPVGVWITDEKGVITLGNPAGQDVWGGARWVGPEEYGAYKGWSLDTGKPIEEWALARALRRGERTVGEQVQIEAFDGRRKIILNSAVPIRDERGRIVGAIVVNQDITRLKEAENEIRRLNADLERRVSERTAELQAMLRELESFAYTVAHDLRAPLRTMSGMSELLLSDYAGKPLDEGGQDYARRIAAAAQRMDALILGLLDYSRMTREEVGATPLSLDDLVREQVVEMEGELRERDVELAVEPSGLSVRGHRATLGMALRNLLSNAAKFVRPDVRPWVRVRAERRDERVRLWVEDNGIGIPPEHRERIFGVFQRLHPPGAFPGTGIGLAIVRKAAERMGGQAGVESEPGRGSRFWLELPAARTGTARRTA